MEKQEEVITLDMEVMAKWIHEKTGIRKEDIDVVLAAESDYYVEIGLAEVQEEFGE